MHVIIVIKTIWRLLCAKKRNRLATQESINRIND